MCDCYIFLTYDIHFIGGSQMYVYGKTESFISEGIDAKILFSGINYGKADIPFFNDYLIGGNQIIGSFKPAQFSEIEIKKIIAFIKNQIGFDESKYNRVFIESHDDRLGLWGEVLAREIGALHICNLINEYFHADFQVYDKYIDFFMYKNRRGEISGLLEKLFDRYDVVPYSNAYLHYAYEKEPIDDIEDTRLLDIKDADYTIAYIGRGNKEYIPSIIQSIVLFSEKYPRKTVQFITVGELSDDNNLHIQDLKRMENVILVTLGNMIPIPRKLYKHIDVVIANSQTARFSAYEGTPVINVSSENGRSNGVVGYDCKLDDFDNGNYDICDILEKVLVKKEYDNQKIVLPHKKDYKESYRISYKELCRIYSECDISYYDVRDRYDEDRWINNPIAGVLKINKNYTWTSIEGIYKSRKICIFGCGNEGKRCLNMLRDIREISDIFFCDNDSERWGSNLDGCAIYAPEILYGKVDIFVIIANAKRYDEICCQLKKDLEVKDDYITWFTYLEMLPMYDLLKGLV